MTQIDAKYPAFVLIVIIIIYAVWCLTRPTVFFISKNSCPWCVKFSQEVWEPLKSSNMNFTFEKISIDTPKGIERAKKLGFPLEGGVPRFYRDGCVDGKFGKPRYSHTGSMSMDEFKAWIR